MAHFAENAGLIAALPADDPERQAAAEHAESCAACRGALEQGTKLVTYLGALPPPAPPTTETLARVSAAIGAELDRESMTAKRANPRLAVSISVALVIVWALLLVSSRRQAGLDAWLASTLMALAVALVFLGSPPRQRPRATLAVLAGASLAFAAWAGELPGLEVAIGVKCTLTELVASAAPLFAAYLGARSAGSWNTMFTAATAAGGALVGHAALHLTCPVSHHASHLLVFHTGGVLLAAAVGAFAGRLRPSTVTAG